jgi:uncharacterized protein
MTMAALALALAVMAGGVPRAARAQAPVNLAFATLDTGSAWYVYGATMAELLRKTLPPGSNIDVKPRAGGVGNPRLVAKNETPLGFSFTVTNRWAWDGKEAYDQKLDNLRGLVGGLDTYYLVAVTNRKLGIGSIQDIKDRKLPIKMVTQPVGSLGEFAGRQLLRAHGITYADIKAWGGSTQHVGYNVIIDAFKDGRANVLFAVVTPKHPSVSEIASAVDVKFVGLEPGMIAALAPLGYLPATMPPDTFKNQAERSRRWDSPPCSSPTGSWPNPSPTPSPEPSSRTRTPWPAVTPGWPSSTRGRPGNPPRSVCPSIRARNERIARKAG